MTNKENKFNFNFVRKLHGKGTVFLDDLKCIYYIVYNQYKNKYLLINLNNHMVIYEANTIEEISIEYKQYIKKVIANENITITINE